MSNYEDRMAEKYNFLKKDKSEINTQKEEATTDEKITSEKSVNEIQESDSLLVPLDAWNTVLNQLGNLHESSQLMAEARERAAKAEAEADFLREKLLSAYLIGYPIEKNYLNDLGFWSSKNPEDIGSIIQFQTVGERAIRQKLKSIFSYSKHFKNVSLIFRRVFK